MSQKVSVFRTNHQAAIHDNHEPDSTGLTLWADFIAPLVAIGLYALWQRANARANRDKTRLRKRYRGLGSGDAEAEALLQVDLDRVGVMVGVTDRQVFARLEEEVAAAQAEHRGAFEAG